MGPTVREAVPADDAAIAQVRRSTYPHLVTTAEVIARLTTSEPVEARSRSLVAEIDDHVVGTVHAAVDVETGRTRPGTR